MPCLFPTAPCFGEQLVLALVRLEDNSIILINVCLQFLQIPLVLLLIEVLSSPTEAFERGNKFADYRQLETLQEYVLINSK